MNIYLISQNQRNGLDTYDSAVVIAKDESIAATLSPGTGKIITDEQWKMDDTWCSNPSKVTVKLIGQAELCSVQGVVCASFNAG